jgi:hypothetical protein
MLGRRPRSARPAPVVLALALALAGALLAIAAEAHAAPAGLPDVDITLVAEIPDTAGWLAMHQEAIGSASAGKPLRLGLPVGTGGTRWLRVDEPKFSVAILAASGQRVVKLGVTGKLPAGEALGALVLFEHAAIEVQAGIVPNELNLIYGLSSVSARLLELYFSRP